VDQQFCAKFKNQNNIETTVARKHPPGESSWPAALPMSLGFNQPQFQSLDQIQQSSFVLKTGTPLHPVVNMMVYHDAVLKKMVVEVWGNSPCLEKSQDR
jgi:hypothetical protein